MTSPALELRHLSKRFADRPILDDLSLTVMPGEIMVILGDSGSGKTTALRLIAGLETPDDGEIWIAGTHVAGTGRWTPPEKRGVGMVFQDYALFPHLTAAGNVAFALHAVAAATRGAHARALLERVGLTDAANRYPHQLSGGEQQRVALARALAAAPRVVLLDEPFSNLDARLRRSLREEVVATLRSGGTTAIFVTHDQEEALQLADRIAVVRAGRVLQVGTPRQLYNAPTHREVARFVGDANFVPGAAAGERVETALGTLTLRAPTNGRVEVLIRPEALTVQPDLDGGAIVMAVRFYGHEQALDLLTDDGSRLTARARPDREWTIGVRVRVGVEGVVTAYPL